MKAPIKAPIDLTVAARRIFREMVDEYAIRDTGGLKILHAGLTAWDRAEAARDQIKKDGMLVPDRFGIQKPHGLLSAERDARAQWLQALKLLNLNIGGHDEAER
jgi:hypothetical protein